MAKDGVRRILVTGGTSDDTAPIATFVINVKATNSHLFDKIIVFHNGISKKNQMLMRGIMDVEFRRYKCPVDTRNGVVVNYFSAMVFCKYECLRLLNEYDEVVWSDYDVVIRDKLDDIVKYNKDIYFGAVTSSSMNLLSKLYKNMSLDLIAEKYNLEGQAILASLMVFKKGIGNPLELLEWCYDTTRRYDRCLFSPEEAVISMMCQEKKIRISELCYDIYSALPENPTSNAIILHSIGNRKFWNAIKNPIWEDNYAKWIEMGGSRYSDTLKKLRKKAILVKSKLRGIKDSGRG